MIDKNFLNCAYSIEFERHDEIYIKVGAGDFKAACMKLCDRLKSPAMSYFAVDERMENKTFRICCLFISAEHRKCFFVSTSIPEDNPSLESLSKDIHSTGLFEREMKEMFGIEFLNSPDSRRLNLHDEVWPEGAYPLRKGPVHPESVVKDRKYEFKKVEGEGVFEIPVGPVHAGVIGPGHFRFSCAGEPIINLETRLGFTHRGIEKLLEGKFYDSAMDIVERISGDSVFAHSTAFSVAIEKILGIKASENLHYLRAALLELERIYNHVNDIGGIALDVGFTYPSAYASLIKESLLSLNKKLTGHRYIRGVNAVGGLKKRFTANEKVVIDNLLKPVIEDFAQLKHMLLSSTSFMDRVDSTGILRNKTAHDLGVVGLAGRASGVILDTRKHLPSIYDTVNFDIIKYSKGDVLARLNIRFDEFDESIKIIRQCMERYESDDVTLPGMNISPARGFAIGCAEGWRGPVLYWVKMDGNGVIDRCKIVDPSFHNWPGLSYAVLGNIVPDFPLCNKSFDLSYSGNDL